MWARKAGLTGEDQALSFSFQEFAVVLIEVPETVVFRVYLAGFGHAPYPVL